MKRNCVSSALVLIVNEQLLLPSKLGKIPNGDNTIGGCRGQNIAIQCAPSNIIRGIAEILIFADSHVAHFREAFSVNRIDFEHWEETFR